MGHFVFLTAIAVWLGGSVSFLSIVVPMVQNLLRPDAADALLDRLLNRHHLLGILCGLTALAAVSLTPGGPELPFSERIRLAATVTLALLCTVVIQYSLLPRARDLRISSPADYERLQRLAALLHNIVLAMLVLAVATIAFA